MKEVKAFAPATVANVACGFDILGFAVDSPGDEIEMKLVDKPGIVIKDITGDEGRLSRNPRENTATVSVYQFLEKIGAEKAGIEVTLHKKMPFGSGLGSSSASTVAGAFAVNALFDNPLSMEELLPFAMEGERVACGAAHADNVAPALYGGFVLVRSYDPLDVVRLNVPEELCCAVVHPHIEVSTKDARNILRGEVPLADAVRQWGNVGGLIAGLEQENYDLIGRSLQDVVVEPIRSMLIPGFDEVKRAAVYAGSMGTAISGSGPSVFSLCKGMEKAERIANAKVEAFKAIGIDSDKFVSKVNKEGPKIIY
ncbi:homoserine kinase [Flammeovirga yaeyamensis]|uniref:Homoserine kinase n=1 Tax=Flammeovirga yaeyamensis TaxID=367791 RepID=A0AAX1N3Z3_9BACT|nr:homoserine kinase [Flammeovirga yaeyamensis]MBB3701015.1 homoserine kinase [Flammeovirga yaeyamensis]NMF38151.1 homoserine kinase [Flammeovirga yaeyamensis]QWG01922.1 homoserine kinase [Flammeovirga yaeyamensis]